MGETVLEVKTIQEQVVDNLRQLLLDGDYAPGDKLQQDELAARLGVSAMPVREGLRQLQTEGLVDFISRKGAYVARLTPDEFDELYHMREELETLALRWAVERLGEADFRYLADVLDQVEEAEARGDVRRRAVLVRSFLWSIFGAAGRLHLFDAIRRYYNMTYLYQRRYSEELALAPRRARIYRRMLHALQAGDVEPAIAAHRENYALIRETMLPLLRAQIDASLRGKEH
jgi:DNA-binding GntR family transcriptional regulator